MYSNYSNNHNIDKNYSQPEYYEHDLVNAYGRQNSSNQYVQQPFNQMSYNFNIKPEVKITTWWPMFSKGLFILARTYDPENTIVGHEKIDPLQAQQYMFNFVTSLVYLFPDRVATKYGIDFIMMKEHVANALVNRVPKFFYAFPQYYDMIMFRGAEFFNTCLKSSASLFNWVYLFQAFLFLMLQDNGVPMTIPTLNNLRDEYHFDKLSKPDWGNAIWYIIHMTALYAPPPLYQSFFNYRIMLESLQYILPCPKCRNHLKQNLKKINLSTCGQSNIDLFRCSWQLHNIVNASINTPQLSFEDAIVLYMS